MYVYIYIYMYTYYIYIYIEREILYTYVYLYHPGEALFLNECLDSFLGPLSPGLHGAEEGHNL